MTLNDLLAKIGDLTIRNDFLSIEVARLKEELEKEKEKKKK